MVLFNNSNLIDMKRYFVIMDEETTGIGLSIVHFPKSYVMWDFSLSENQSKGISFACKEGAQGFANMMPDDDVKVVCEECIY